MAARAKTKKAKYVYFFGGGKSEGKAKMKELLGGKGANLAEMADLGLPVPAGFTLTTEACNEYYKLGKKKFFELIREEVEKTLAKLEKETGKTFGKGKNPLLLSVRSGAAVSMPGMMDTVLNLGMNEETAGILIKRSGNERFVMDSYRRFIQMFGDVVMGVPHHDFEAELDAVKKKKRVKLDTDLGVDDLKMVISRYKAVVKRDTGKDFPSDPMEQLFAGIDAVFGSWNNPRAIKYRQLNEIRGLLGTAVNVQAMVFGNSGNNSATGVAFTRDPSTGENRYFYGEYLINAQGEDVVAGIRTPQQITIKGSKEWAKSQGIREKDRKQQYPSLEETMPKVFKRLDRFRVRLEKHYLDMQDLEFTIENGKLYMLQTRNGKRTAAAAVKIATDLVKEGLITEKEAVLRVDPSSLDQLLHPVFIKAAEDKANKLTTGLPASPGAATGQVVFSAHEAELWAEMGKNVILCRTETSPEDIGGMAVAKGILTSRGGMTSHAAVVARGMGICCVAGAGDVEMDYKKKKLNVGRYSIAEGDWISLNGSTGGVYKDEIDTVEPKLAGPFGEIMALADKYRKLGVRTNADTPHDAAVAVKFGAEGIGLCRTEHMFFEGDRIVAFRKLILVAEEVKTLRRSLGLAEGEELKAIAKKLEAPLSQYYQALDDLLPLQRSDFKGIFRALKGRPCTIRLLDPPLHEFLPHDAAGQKEMAKTMGVKPAQIKQLVESLHEFNPMLGHRGCRLGMTYPEVTEMQTRAICEAACAVKGSQPEIMVPLVGNVNELVHQKAIIQRTIAMVEKEKKKKLKVLIGTMIEVPRAAMTADEIAKEAQFFSFGTNDLTQMGCGFSRDDAAKFLGEYVANGVYEHDPFQVLDQTGVGRMVETAVKLGKKSRRGLKLGICGEHGGEPRSVAFCHKVGLNYVSCSPYRVPIARLAAAHAVLSK
ncbi:MAG: pyruvate, phosphate dikinase [Kiritimatiellia bacterium]|jgi:pyruvate,orthophosphate dikinase|nr:pyruvate, phosphate dikinase [Kiritimatiellia bacterium]MDP6847633.1 pyruvate, phosphate dikinase [Kiritimatiellia bacterium]